MQGLNPAVLSFPSPCFMMTALMFYINVPQKTKKKKKKMEGGKKFTSFYKSGEILMAKSI